MLWWLVLESRFETQMGSPHLLAHGLDQHPPVRKFDVVPG